MKSHCDDASDLVVFTRLEVIIVNSTAFNGGQSLACDTAYKYGKIDRYKWLEVDRCKSNTKDTRTNITRLQAPRMSHRFSTRLRLWWTRRHNVCMETRQGCLRRVRTLHGVGVITKSYFVGICCINGLESRLEVIQGHTFWHHSIDCVYDFIYGKLRQLMVTFALQIQPFQIYCEFCTSRVTFSTSISSKIWGGVFPVE